MQISSRFLIVALIVLAAPLSGFAQSIKPGLWEVTTQLGGNPEADKAMAQMQKEMAGMSAEQRKQMAAMMGQQGISLGNKSAGVTSKMCITKDMADRHQMPVQKQGDCTSTTSNRTASGLSFKFACVNPASSGEGQYVFAGDSAYTMKMTLNALEQGKRVTTSMDGSGKWLGSDCGSIKPVAVPK